MADEFLSDREQEEALRHWWNENWRWVIGGVAAGFVLLGAWNYWQRHTEQLHDDAARAFRDLTAAAAGGDKAKVDAAIKNLDDNFSGSPYADQGHLMLAQSHVLAGRYEQAAAELKTVADKSKDVALAQVAKLRLARVHIQLGHYDEALALLDVAKAGKFIAETNEVRGDALLAKGDAAGARQAYQAALTAGSANAGGGDNSYLQLKIQDLAGAAPEKQAASTPPPTEK